MLFTGEFFAGACVGAHVLSAGRMHVSLRSQEWHGLWCHKFEAELISNLKVTSMSAHINYSLHFFVSFFCHLKSWGTIPKRSWIISEKTSVLPKVTACNLIHIVECRGNKYVSMCCCKENGIQESIKPRIHIILQLSLPHHAPQWCTKLTFSLG